MKDEFVAIAELQRRFARKRSDVAVGIGDDAAVLMPSKHAQALTVDVVVEGVHFKREYLSWTDLGRRALLAAASDVTAMGGTARVVVVSLVLPADFETPSLEALADGLAQGADECGAAIVGGNLSRGTEVSIATSVLGDLLSKPLTRSGASAGDRIYVTGVLGANALGLRACQQALSAEEPLRTQQKLFRDRWRRPPFPTGLGLRLSGVATACIDVSDGLVQDLQHLCEASGAGAEVWVEALPTAPHYEELARGLGCDPRTLSLEGGEDYELLFTMPAAVDEPPPVPAAHIGRMRGDCTAVRVLAHGQEVCSSGPGWRHF